MPKKSVKEVQKKGNKSKILDLLEATKSDIVGFQGGMDVKLDKKLKSSGENLRDKLSHDLGEWLEQEIKNQQPRIDKLSEWQKLYRGQRDTKNIPYPKCANVAIPITRINTEAISVRVLDGLHNRPKVFIVEPKDTGDPQKNEMFQQIAPMLEDDLNWWAMEVVNLKKKLFSPTQQSIKSGTGILKMWPVSKKRTVTRYAKEEESNDPNIPTFKLKGGQDAIKEVVTSYEGADIFPISREDYVQSSDSISIQEAFFIGFRTYHRMPDIEMKVRQGLYDEIAADNLTVPDELDETKKDRITEQHKEVPEHLMDKIEIWELWLRYDVDEDGEEDDIVVTFHRGTNTILRCIYNPIFNGFRPFIDLIFNPVEFCFDGEGTCEILEKLQLQIDSLHNMYLDRLVQINSPVLFVQSGQGIDINKIIPGMKVSTDTDPKEAIYEFRYSDQTYTILPEEGRLLDYANKATGVTPDILGQPTADRPVFKEMLSRVQEANKKFKFGIDNYRDKISELGMMYLEFSAQYQPTHSYYSKDGKGEPERKTINYPVEYLRDGINVKVAASNELLNTEVRREVAQQRYALLEQYHTNLGSMVQAMESPYLPASFKQLLVKVSEIDEKELENMLRDMDTIDPESMVLKIADVVNIPQAMTMSGMQPPPEGGGEGQGGGGEQPPTQGQPQ